MPKKISRLLILSIDIGSSSTRSALFNESARPIEETMASQSYNVHYSADGGAELSAPHLLRAATHCCKRTLLRHRGSRSLARVPIAAVAASSFWHGLLGLDRQSRPITPVFTWADSRAANDAARLRELISEPEILARTGCMVRAPFWPAKLLWLRRTHPKLFGRVCHWVSPADWIFRQLFKVIGTSHSMASATGLFDLARKNWDRRLCAACQVDVDSLPAIRDESEISRQHRLGLKPDAKIFLAIGDGAAGNLGSGATLKGIAAINVGTSAAVRTIQSKAETAKIPFGLFRYLVDSRRLVIGGAVSNAGNLREWCLRELHLDETAAEQALSREAVASDRLNVLPFWVKERSPSWPDQQSGVIAGLNQSTSAADIFRAVTTSVFYRLAEILDLLQMTAGRTRRIIVSGGIGRSPAAVKLLADVLGRDVDLLRETEASLRGAAVYALGRIGLKPGSARISRTIKCNSESASRHRERWKGQVELEDLFRTKSPDRQWRQAGNERSD